MRSFSTPKKLLLSTMYLCACLTWPVYAEENTPAVQQPAVDIAPENETQPDIDEPEPTPQPPLIDTQPTQSYEPEAPQDTPAADATIEEEANAAEQRIIGDTPQPPLIDAQQKPSYGPTDVDGSPQEGDTITTDKPAEVTQEPENGKPAKAEVDVNEITAPLDASEEFPESTDIEQETVSAEETEVAKEQAKEEKERQAKKWTETYPVSVNADWLQLKSGEWLRGHIIIMQKDSLEFDSDELDDLVIKWKNVKYLKSYEPYSLRFDSLGHISTTGIIEVIGNKVHIKTDYDDQTFDRSDLLTIASGKETEISYWKNKITFSINVRRGNTDQTDFTSKMSAKRRTTDSSLALDYLGNFTQVEEIETINNHRINETYNIFLDRELFWTPIFSEYFRDPFQNIDQRIKAGIGIGYSIINTNETEWDVLAGPAFQQTKFVSVQQDTHQVDRTFAAVLSTKFDTELNSKVDLEGQYTTTLGDDETGNYSHHSLLTVETELTDTLDFDVTAVWDYVHDPVTAENGIKPENSDFRILIGLGYDL